MSADGFYVSESMCRACLRRDAEKELSSFHKPTSQSYFSILATCIPFEVKYNYVQQVIELLKWHNF